jgi:hypothetical protein
VNLETGITTTVSGESFGKMMSQSSVERSTSSQAHMQALGNLDTLFRLAMKTSSRPPKKPGDTGIIEEIHHFVVPMPFEGDVLAVKIMAKRFVEEKQETRLYFRSCFIN